MSRRNWARAIRVPNLIENDNGKANGQIGFGLAAQPLGSTFTAGSQTILQLTFTSIGSQGTTTPITFGDSPVIRQIADPNALPLPSSSVDGAVTITGPPCAQPTFSPAAGTYSTPQSVTISTTTSGATINYTTDGTTPSETVGTVYSTPVTVGKI